MNQEYLILVLKWQNLGDVVQERKNYLHRKMILKVALKLCWLHTSYLANIGPFFSLRTACNGFWYHHKAKLGRSGYLAQI